MEERTYKVTGTRQVFGVLPAQHFKAKVGPEAEADMTEEQANALIDGGHIAPSNAKNASPINEGGSE